MKARMNCSSIKTMFIKFFNISVIVHRDFIPQGQTVNTKFYCEVLRHLRENIRRKQLDLWCVRNWILHDDNAPSLSTPHLWVSRQPQHVIASTPALLTRFSSCRLLPFPEDDDAVERSPHFHTVAEIQHESQTITHTWSQKHQYSNSRC
jgi:hypothetical protein